MTLGTTPPSENSQGVFYRAVIPCPKGSQALTFSISPRGILSFDNRQPKACLCAVRSCSLSLAKELLQAARNRSPDALRGRTPEGLAFELRVHYRLYRLRILRSHTGTTEMGSTAPAAPDYDSNAAFFEFPLRCLRGVRTFIGKGNNFPPP